MNTTITTIEDVLADENFQSWHAAKGDVKAQAWELWLLENPSAQPLVVDAINFLSGIGIKESEVPVSDVHAAFEKMQQRIAQAPVVPMKKRSNWWIAAAAIVVLAIGAALFLNAHQRSLSVNSSYGSIRNYDLPDGSKVILNANSSITLGNTWATSGDREVWLKGEAFFQVHKNPTHNRFIVHAGNMDIIVTGTQFNAVNRDDEHSVLLTEGSVTLVMPDGKKIAMKPGDFVRLEKSLPSLQPVDQEKLLAWKESKLDFDNTPMNEVAKIINRHYGVKVALTDSLTGERRISGMMPNDNLDALIRALEATGEFKITKSDNGLTISAL